MYSEEEPELRDLIIQNLENCGLLKKIKAELRAGVFLALEEDGNLRKKIPLFNEKLDNYVATSEGRLMLSLVREFLVYFSLDFTLSVFDPEVATSSPCFSRSELCDQLNLKISEMNGPVISELLKNIPDREKIFRGKSSNERKTVAEKSVSILNETETEKILLENTFKFENSDFIKKKTPVQNNMEIDSVIRSSEGNMKEPFDNTNIFLESDVGDIVKSKALTDIPLDKGNGTKTDSQADMFKETKDMVSSDHDPFFDEPVPSEKSSFFNFSETLKDKSEIKSTSNTKRDLDDSKRSSLSSLKDLPSLTANHEWTFSRDPMSDFPSLDLLKSSTEASKEEIVNLDSKENFEKKDSDIAESNEDSSEKQISEESIEEQLEDDFSAGMDDLLNSSLSLGDDVTTDQTVSQVSVVEGVDHIEPCNS